MKGWLLAAMWLAAVPAQAEPKPSVVTNPDWAELPSGEMMAANYPMAAMFLEIQGLASITCSVTDKGLLEGCAVAAEIPRDLGFGPAALRMSHAFRMRPMTRDGKPVSGGEVRIPIRFTLPDVTPEARPAPAPGRAASPQGLALAQRIVAATQPAETYVSDMQMRLAEMEADPATPEAPRVAAAQALRSAVDRHREELRRAAIADLAAAFSDDDLARIAAFVASPAGRILQRDADREQALTELSGQLGAVLVDESRKAYCGRRRCVRSAEEDRILDAPIPATDRVWSASPSAASVAAAAPPLAQAIGVAGAARLGCRTNPAGRLAGCRVLAEAPAGWSFGEAALSLAGSYWAPAGTETERTLRIDFPAPPIPRPTPPRRTSSAVARAAARDLILALYPQDQLSAGLEMQLRSLAATLPNDYDDATAKALTEALHDAQPATLDYLVEGFADILASRYPKDDIVAAARFVSSPPGDAFVKSAQADEGPASLKVRTQIGDEARAAYCEAHDCSAPPARAAATP